ncbi:MAG: hypothetical protein LBP59_00745 [Planctomycetaceae bacterium]|nr:hypothetical protein [Planctomycetaceae bacterium]
MIINRASLKIHLAGRRLKKSNAVPKRRITYILLVLEIQRFKSVKACRPKARQAKVNANSSTNSLKQLLNFNNS